MQNYTDVMMKILDYTTKTLGLNAQELTIALAMSLGFVTFDHSVPFEKFTKKETVVAIELYEAYDSLSQREQSLFISMIGTGWPPTAKNKATGG